MPPEQFRLEPPSTLSDGMLRRQPVLPQCRPCGPHHIALLRRNATLTRRGTLLHLVLLAFGHTESNAPTLFAAQTATQQSRYAAGIGATRIPYRLSSNPIPLDLHTSIRHRVLIPAHYSCHPSYSVGTKDQGNQPRFITPALVPRQPKLHETFRKGVITFLASIRRHTPRPCLRVAMTPLNTVLGRACLDGSISCKPCIQVSPNHAFAVGEMATEPVSCSALSLEASL